MKKNFYLLISVIFIAGLLACGSQGGESQSKEKESKAVKESFCADMFKAAHDGDIETIKQGIEAGININKTDAYEQTILMVAAEFGHFEIVKYLLQKGADKTIQNIHDQTAESIAINSDIANYIKKYGEYIE
jgi:ankyrin repeat protein